MGEPGEAEAAGLAANDSQVRWTLVPPTRWMTFYCADPFVVACAEAPPPYATQELAASWCGAQLAGVAAHCQLCEAVALEEGPVMREGAAAARRRVPHAPECLFSAETIARLDAGCRPAGYRAPPVTEEEIELLADAVAGIRNFHSLVSGQ